MRPTGAFRHQTAAQGSGIRRAVATLQALEKKTTDRLTTQGIRRIQGFSSAALYLNITFYSWNLRKYFKANTTKSR